MRAASPYRRATAYPCNGWLSLMADGIPCQCGSLWTFMCGWGSLAFSWLAPRPEPGHYPWLASRPVPDDATGTLPHDDCLGKGGRDCFRSGDHIDSDRDRLLAETAQFGPAVQITAALLGATTLLPPGLLAKLRVWIELSASLLRSCVRYWTATVPF